MKKGITKYTNILKAGQKIGKWTILGEFKQINKNYHVLAKCECGYENYINCGRIANGESQSCKCILVGSNNKKWTGIGEINGKILYQIKASAKKRNIEYSISDEFLLELLIKQNKKCFLTGLDLIFSGDNKKHTASLDRIDSNLGYIESNVVWVHKDINILKNSFSWSYILNICERINTYGRKNIQNNNLWKKT